MKGARRCIYVFYAQMLADLGNDVIGVCGICFDIQIGILILDADLEF